jgi:uncharacterized protein (DUF1778 family)
MPLPRTRTLTFRVTHDEYDQLKLACAAAGGRSLSDFMRTYLLAGISSDAERDAIRQHLGEIDQRLADLCSLVKRLSGTKVSEPIGIS